MINLAPWRYRNITNNNSNLIKEIRNNLIPTFYGTTLYETLVFLNDELRYGINDQKYTIYGTPDGTGTDKNSAVATYKAISEALERWAFYENTSPEIKIKLYGFDVDTSTTGMAAYPDFSNKRAKEYAKFEAIERWALISWWDGYLSTRPIEGIKYPNVSGCEIITPFKDTNTIIIWVNTPKTKVWAYGFATSNNIQKAIDRAIIELDRNVRVLDYYISETKKSLETILVELPALLEKRLIYFATNKGHQTFKEHISEHIDKNISLPDLLVDTEIKGAWSKYAKVYRVLYRPINDISDTDRIDYFLF